MSLIPHISLALAVTLVTPAYAALQWSVYRTEMGNIELRVTDGLLNSQNVIIQSSDYELDQPMTVTLSANAVTSQQHIGLEWTSSNRQPSYIATTLPFEGNAALPERVRMRWARTSATPIPTDLNAPHQIGRFLLHRTTAAGLLLHGVQTNFDQPRPWGYLEGDVDADEQVNVFDLLQVISHWTTWCDLNDPCQGDADFDGDVDVDDLLVVIRSFQATSESIDDNSEYDGGDVVSGTPGKHVAWSWSPATMDAVDSIVPFIWAPSWRTPEAVAADTAHRPDGHRVVFFFANIVNDLSLHPEDACLDHMGNLTAYRSPWIDHGITTVRDRIRVWMESFVAAGGSLDAVILDNEYTLSASQFMQTDGVGWGAIMGDPRFPALAEDLGFNDLQSIYWGNDRFNQWNRIMERRFDAALDVAVFDVVREHFPDAACSNYNSFIHDEDLSSLGIEGHSLFRLTDGCGTHDSRSFYGRISTALAESHLEDGSVVGNEAWSALMVCLHRLRGMRRSSSNGPLMAWVCNRSWGGSTRWPSLLQNDPLWDELVIHLGMHGVDRFLYWTETNPLQNPTDPEGNPEQDQQRINELMTELDVNIGDLSPGDSLNQPSFAERVTASSVSDGQSVVWRFSFHPDIAGVTVRLDNGDQFYVQPEPGRRGAWFTHPAHLTLSINERGSSPLLTAVIPLDE